MGPLARSLEDLAEWLCETFEGDKSKTAKEKLESWLKERYSEYFDRVRYRRDEDDEIVGFSLILSKGENIRVRSVTFPSFISNILSTIENQAKSLESDSNG